MLAADACSIGWLLMPDSNTTISRQELFDLVWSRSITQIATDFGVSTTGVAKACKSLNVPTPPSAYWARLRHGKKVSRPALPAAGTGEADTTTFGQWLEERRRLLGAFKPKLIEVPPMGSSRVHPVIRETRVAYRNGGIDRIYGTLQAKAGTNHVKMFLTPVCLDRALDILDRLVWVLERNGFTFEESKKAPHEIRPVYASTRTELDFGVREALERYERDLTPEEKKQPLLWDRWRFRGTGRLRVTLNEVYPEGVRKIWRDEKAGGLEGMLGKIVEGFVICARGKHEQELESQERLRRLDEEARLREETEQRRLEEEKRYAAFREAARRWAEARTLRAFRAACEVRWRQLRPNGVLTEDEEKWLRWADAVIRRTDPLAGDDPGKAPDGLET